MEVSRGCPYHCTFCAKENFRNRYRRRPLATILDELDGLIAAGATYVYFIDEIFLPWRELLEELRERPVEFGVQTRIDLWRPDMLDLLGRAGCVSIEAGVESLSAAERDRLDKDCRLSTDELTERLIYAKRRVPFVQANLIATGGDDPADIARWRDALQPAGSLGERPGAAVSLPGLAGLSPPLGDARRQRLGAGARLVSRSLRRVQRHPGGAAASPRRAGADVMHDGDRRPLTVLMTADAVGGVWHYALALCAALPEIRFVLAVMGPMPSAAQRDAAGRLDNVVLEEYGHRLEWMQGAAGNLDSSRHWLTLLARRYRADLLHVNGYAHARNETGLPTLAVAHSDVLSWWQRRAPRGGAARVGAVPARSHRRAARRRPGRGADRRRARRSGAPLRVRPRLPALVIPNGIDIAFYAPQPKRAAIMAAGRLWDEAKNLALLDDSRRRSRLAGRDCRGGEPPRGGSGPSAGGARARRADPGRNGRAARVRPRSMRRRHGTNLLALAFSKPPPAAARWCSATFRHCGRTGTAPRCSRRPTMPGPGARRCPA